MASEPTPRVDAATEEPSKRPVAPSLSITWDPRPPVEKERVSFRLLTDDPDQQVRQALWEFGDGTSQQGIDVDHAFPRDGTYYVQVTVEGSAGWRAQAGTNVTVYTASGHPPETEPEPAPPPDETEPPVESSPPTPQNRTILAVGDAAPEPFVVVATFDTGTNPFHPTWRGGSAEHPATYIPGYPVEAAPLNLTLAETFEESWAESEGTMERLHDRSVPLHFVPGTRLIGLWSREGDQRPIFDPIDTTHYHGARASSQIAGAGYGLGEEAFLAVFDRTLQDAGGSGSISSSAGVAWAADQSWIDIIHLNVAELAPAPGVFSGLEEIEYAVSKGKLVVVAGGNGAGNAGAAYPTETSSISGPPGSLVAGANDNCGYSYFSNLDPHVVMDGQGTVAAHEVEFTDASFSGTSSSSPRTAGYAAKVLLDLRRAVDDRYGSRDGHLLVLDDSEAWPESGPLQDGRLHVSEFHEVIRKTADPNPHDSAYDGSEYLPGQCIPQPADLPFSMYPKMGYGEVSEHTAGPAVQVLLGAEPMPKRPDEDQWYEASQMLRETLWG